MAGDSEEVAKLSTHGGDMLQAINDLRDEVALSDVTVVVGGKQFLTHKVILCAASSYFKAMFTSGFSESSKSEITIEGDSLIFEKIMEFMYTGEFRLTDDILPDVIQMASYFQFIHVLTVCERFLQKRLRNRDISFDTIVQVSIAYGPVSNIAEDHLATNFLDIIKEPTFDDLPVAILENFLDRNDLTALSMAITEDHVFKAVTKWLAHDWEKRHGHAERLLRKVRLGMVPELSLTEAFTDQLLSVPECKQLYEDVVKDHYQIYDGLKVEHEEIFKQRGVTLLMSFTKIHDRQLKAKYFNTKHMTWQSIDGICYWPTAHTKPEYSYVDRYEPGRRNIDQIISDGNKLYVNIDLKPEYKNFFCYNPFTTNWLVKSYMTGMLKESSWSSMGGCLYVVGGRKSRADPWENKVLRYETDPGCWSALPSIPIPEDSIEVKEPPVAVTHKGKVLVYKTLEKRSGGARARVIFVCFPATKASDSQWFCFPIKITAGVKPQEVQLVTDEKKCYRLSYSPNMIEGKPFVNELEFNFKKVPSCVEIGKAHDQRYIPENEVGAFRLGHQVYANLNGYIHKLGMRTSKDKEVLANIKKVLSALQEATHPVNDNDPVFVKHTFTKYSIKVGLPVK